MTYKKSNIFVAAVLMMLIFIDWQTPVPLIFYGAIFVIYLLINVWGTLFISSNFFLPAKCKAPITSGSVAITFDDGPVAEKTERVLEILKKHNAKATFFCIGKNVKEHPELTKQIHNEGHLIGNHSYHHEAMFDLQSTKKINEELADTNQIIHETIGRTPRFFRPPYGITNPLLANAVKELNFVTIGWSIRSFDTIAQEKQKLFTRITKNLKAGDIILLHDRCDITIETLPELLIHIKSIGLKVEPLDKLLEEQAYA